MRLCMPACSFGSDDEVAGADHGSNHSGSSKGSMKGGGSMKGSMREGLAKLGSLADKPRQVSAHARTHVSGLGPST